MTLHEFTDGKTSLAMNLERMEQIYRDRTSLTPAQIEEFHLRAVFFDATAAHNAGNAHEVAEFLIPTPFLDPWLLLNRNFAIGLLVTFFMGMLAFTSLVLLPHPVA